MRQHAGTDNHQRAAVDHAWSISPPPPLVNQMEAFMDKEIFLKRGMRYLDGVAVADRAVVLGILNSYAKRNSQSCETEEKQNEKESD